MFARLTPLAMVLVVSLVAGGCASEPLTAPSPLASSAIVVAAAPASIKVSAQNGIGTTAGTVYVSAWVYDAAERPLANVALTFATTAGTVTPTVVLSDGLGYARATVTTSGQADVSVGTGSVSSAMTVTPVAIPAPVAPTPPVIIPTPSPSPTPPPSVAPTPDPLRVDVIVNASSSTVGQLVQFSAFASSEIVSAAWDFGDGTRVQATGSQSSHTYTATGTVTATVLVTDRSGRTGTGRATITVRPALSAMLGCSAGTTTATASVPILPVSCTVTVYLSGTVIASGLASVTWDWADGSIEAGTTAKSHPYAAPGNYFVTATVTLGGQIAIAQGTAVVTRTPATPGA